MEPRTAWDHRPVIWLALLVAVVLVVLTVAAVLGRVDGSLADATSTMSHVPLPQDPLTVADIEGLRFDTAFRGYRMSEVDAVIDRLRREISDLSAPADHQIAAPLPEPALLHSDAHEPDPPESSSSAAAEARADDRAHSRADDRADESGRTARTPGNVDVTVD